MFLGSVWKEKSQLSATAAVENQDSEGIYLAWRSQSSKLKADCIGSKEMQGRKEKVAAQLSGRKFWISYCSSAALQGFRLSRVQFLSLKDMLFCGTVSPGLFFWLRYFQMSLRKQPILSEKELHAVSKLAEVVSGAVNCVRQSQWKLWTLCGMLVWVYRVFSLTLCFLSMRTYDYMFWKIHKGGDYWWHENCWKLAVLFNSCFSSETSSRKITVKICS